LREKALIFSVFNRESLDESRLPARVYILKLVLKNHGKTKQERVRSHAILLSNDGKTAKELAEIFSVAQRSVFQWFRDFKERSIESLSCQSGRGRKTLLNEEDHKVIIKKI
jgi:hypothetical protein